MTTTTAGTRDLKEDRLWERAAAQIAARTGAAAGKSEEGGKHQLREEEGGADPYCLTAERTTRSSLDSDCTNSIILPLKLLICLYPRSLTAPIGGL